MANIFAMHTEAAQPVTTSSTGHSYALADGSYVIAMNAPTGAVRYRETGAPLTGFAEVTLAAWAALEPRRAS